MIRGDGLRWPKGINMKDTKEKVLSFAEQFEAADASAKADLVKEEIKKRSNTEVDRYTVLPMVIPTMKQKSPVALVTADGARREMDVALMWMVALPGLVGENEDKRRRILPMPFPTEESCTDLAFVLNNGSKLRELTRRAQGSKETEALLGAA